MHRSLLLAFALMGTACDRELLDDPGFARPDLSGSVRIPLSASDADGVTYQLRNATLEISGSAMLTLSAADGAGRGDEEALTTPLPPGSYSLFLRTGYQLVEIDTSGAERLVDAQFVSPNPTRFKLREVEDATLKLAFERDGHTVMFGSAPSLVTSAR